MKKLLSLIITFLFVVNIQVLASDIDILATMHSRSNAQDKVWVGTFQLVWNDFMDKIIHDIVRFREGNPNIVKELNLQSFTTDDLSNKAYYKTTERIKNNTKRKIETTIAKKFNETSDILDQLDLTPAKNRFIIYAMLKKDFEFENEFDKLGTAPFGQELTAEYFGIDNHTDKSVKEGVKVLFYNSPTDYAVVLNTKDNDEVYLYKNGANKPFSYLYRDMNEKTALYKGNKSMTNVDELMIPNIKFFSEKSFDEVTDKRIMGTNYVIDQALETVKFNMDNKGVQLKSEAAMTVMLTSAGPMQEVPRHFYFDDTFVIFLKEKGKNNPYFALRVYDIRKFQ